jgi:xanthine dehydrogenase accessory factor
MLNVLELLLPRWRRGETVAISTVVSVLGSAPLPVGSAQLLTDDDKVFGSVSGGCVEAAVYESNRETLRGHAPAIQVFTVSDDDALSNGLTCGGTLEVFTETIDRTSLPWLEELADANARSIPVATATVVSGAPAGPSPGIRMLVRPDSTEGSLDDDELDALVIRRARELLDMGQSGMLDVAYPAGNGALRVFVQAFAPKPRMIIFGAIDFASALAEAGRFAGYRVTVCDAREVFLTAERFPGAHDLVLKWPSVYLQEELSAGRLDARSALCVLTHDVKFDVPLLDAALRSPVDCYVGAMGSRRTHDDRLGRLRATGLTDEQLGRLRSPIGLDLGGSTPPEVAISIIAEVIAHAHGRTGAPLTATRGTIHGTRSRGPAPVAHPAATSTVSAGALSCELVNR